MKKLKILISIIIVLLIGAAGTLYYFLEVKEYQTADSEVEIITESEYAIELPEATVPTQEPIDKENTDQKDDSIANNSSDEAENSSNGESSSNKSGQEKPAEEKPSNSKVTKPEKETQKLTAEAIKAKYTPVFEELEAQANAKIDKLLSHAFSEYKSKTANGEDISFAYFYSKYNSASKALEASTNDAFNYIYSALSVELEKNGIDKSSIEEFRTQYENAKKERRSSIIKKALEHL